jgi:hypothetical protein
MNNIQRDPAGFITDACLKDMRESLPIEVYVNNDAEPHRIIYSKEELEAYLFGALPYCLTTRYRKVGREQEKGHPEGRPE